MFTKLRRRVALTFAFLVIKTKKNIQTMRQKIFSKDMLIYY